MTSIHDEVVQALGSRPRSLSPKFFYDALGSKLFEAITVTPEYYPTPCEMEILQGRGEEISAVLGPDVSVVELGTGSAMKVLELLGALDKVRAYVPIDISRAALDEAAVHVRRAFPDVEVTPIVGDFTRPLELPSLGEAARNVVFYPGSTIGNFERPQAAAFLVEIATWLSSGDMLLLGADLVKDAAVLERAYNDEAGVTAAFNRNMLLHLNRLVGTDFDVAKFRHEAFWNAELERIEMHLRCVEDHEVRLREHRFRFEAGEGIHTESSHKFHMADVDRMADEAGFARVAGWTDDRGWFGVAIYQRR